MKSLTFSGLMLYTYILLKNCSERQKLLEVPAPQKVTLNAKSCWKVAEHKRDRPIGQGIQTVSGAHYVMDTRQSIFFCKLLM